MHTKMHANETITWKANNNNNSLILKSTIGEKYAPFTSENMDRYKIWSFSSTKFHIIC